MTKSTWTDGFGPIFGRSLDGEVAERALDEQAARADGLEVRAPRDEGDIVAGASELGAVEPADRAGSNHTDSHDVRRNFTTARGGEYSCGLLYSVQSQIGVT